MEFEILDSNGNVENAIVADLDYMHAFYSGRFRPRFDQSFVISKSGFINRFTVEEWESISTSTDPVVIEVAKAIEKLEGPIYLKDWFPRAILESLTSKNLLSLERMKSILETQVNFTESV